MIGLKHVIKDSSMELGIQLVIPDFKYGLMINSLCKIKKLLENTSCCSCYLIVRHFCEVILRG